MDTIKVIGVGNPFRGDDGAGRAVARRVRERGLPGVDVVETSGEGTALMDAWEEAETVILIDAVRSGAPPGTLYRFDARAADLPAPFFHGSTHTFGVAEAVALARLLEQLPPALLVYGIAGACFGPGADLSPRVEQAAEQLAGRIAAALEAGRLPEPADQTEGQPVSPEATSQTL